MAPTLAAISRDAEDGGWSEREVVQRTQQITGLHQVVVTLRYRMQVASLRAWEQGRRAPDATTLAYFRVIERQPEMVAKALVA